MFLDAIASLDLGYDRELSMFSEACKKINNKINVIYQIRTDDGFQQNLNKICTI